MGFFSPLDEKFTAAVSDRFRDELTVVREIAWKEGAGLGFHQRRELQFVVTSIWLDYRARRDSMDQIAPDASIGLVARFQDQSRRIAQRFSEMQTLCLELAAQEVGAEIERREEA